MELLSDSSTTRDLDDSLEQLHRHQLYRDGLDSHRAAEGYEMELSMPPLPGPPTVSLSLVAMVSKVVVEYADRDDTD